MIKQTQFAGIHHRRCLERPAQDNGGGESPQIAFECSTRACRRAWQRRVDVVTPSRPLLYQKNSEEGFDQRLSALGAPALRSLIVLLIKVTVLVYLVHLKQMGEIKH